MYINTLLPITIDAQYRTADKIQWNSWLLILQMFCDQIMNQSQRFYRCNWILEEFFKTRILTGIPLTKQPASLMYQCKLHSAHSSQQLSGNLPDHIFYGYDHNSTESQQHLSNEDHQNNIQNNNRVTGPKVIFKNLVTLKVFSFLPYSP